MRNFRRGASTCSPRPAPGWKSQEKSPLCLGFSPMFTTVGEGEERPGVRRSLRFPSLCSPGRLQAVRPHGLSVGAARRGVEGLLRTL